MAQTKFERAKKGMLKLYRTVILQLIEGRFDKPWINCVFCGEYEYAGCRNCPVFLAEGKRCTHTFWWNEFAQSRRIAYSGRKRKAGSLVWATQRDKEAALVFLLARYGYIESLHE